ncbi:D-cysteine desulfhydrase family protein [Halioxenophilus aromaticivorans]|uniref:Aminocyclopropane-1-carboxylate deaminase/D-cysteine desulfhydrase family protein n=1 Tax=Halioxenophilus aromaticivorans TaxID=1306992 RepID=A0AAV3UAR4_9ALTE
MITLPASTALAHIPTPLEQLNYRDDRSWPRIWIKRDDLTGSGLSGNKVRKLEFVVAHAKRSGADTLITCGGLQSNHCRATALVGARLGLKVHLILREEGGREIEGNLFIDNLAGATIETFSAQEYQANLNNLLAQRAKDYQSQGRTAHVIPTGASDEIGIWGYVKCAQELKSDFQQNAIDPDLIVCATGSGGTQAGLSLGGYAHGLSARVVGYAVCDDADYFNRKALTDITRCVDAYELAIDPQLVPITTVDDYVGPGYAVGYPELYDRIKDVASRTGLLLDPVYTGKAFHGLMCDIAAGKYSGAKDIVFVHTGGTFGLFAQKTAFGFSL